MWNLRFLVTFLTSCRYQHVCMNEIALILVTGLTFDFLLAFNWYYCIFSFEFWGSLHCDCWRIVVGSFFPQKSIAMICFTYNFLKPISASSEIKGTHTILALKGERVWEETNHTMATKAWSSINRSIPSGSECRPAP